MNKNVRPEPFFIAEQPALDLLNSICSPWGMEIEWITNGTDLVSWLKKGKLISHEESLLFLEQFSEKELDNTAKKVIELREYFRDFIKKYAGQPLTKESLNSLEEINDILGRDHIFSQITTSQDGDGLTIQTNRHYSQAQDLLFPLAFEMMNCVCQADFSRIKLCENEMCSLWFLDTSKNGRRRWCSMAVCGNRSKAASHRARLKSSHQAS